MTVCMNGDCTTMGLQPPRGVAREEVVNICFHNFLLIKGKNNVFLWNTCITVLVSLRVLQSQCPPPSIVRTPTVIATQLRLLLVSLRCCINVVARATEGGKLMQ